AVRLSLPAVLAIFLRPRGRAVLWVRGGPVGRVQEQALERESLPELAVEQVARQVEGVQVAAWRGLQAAPSGNLNPFYLPGDLLDRELRQGFALEGLLLNTPDWAAANPQDGPPAGPKEDRKDRGEGETHS